MLDELLISLQEVLKHHMGISRSSILVAIGRRTARKLHIKHAISQFDKFLETLPWALKIVDSNAEKIIIEGKMHPISTGEQIMPECHFLRGYFMEAANLIYGQTFFCEEISCRGLGSPTCRFEISKTT
jgi:predicted hydrocarbon binding protein